MSKMWENISKVLTAKNLLVSLGLAVGSEAVWRIFLWSKNRYETRRKRAAINEVLFFPDNSVRTFKDLSRLTATDYYNLSKVTAEQRLHPDSSLLKLLLRLRSAEKSLDLCLFLITCHEFANVALECLARGVRVRLIVEQSSVGMSGCQVGKLRQAGVFVRSRKQHFLMHHKFALIDNKILVNGSFNWTGQAVMGNNENVVISNESVIVERFVEEFARLWDLFDPDYVEIDDVGLDSSSGTSNSKNNTATA
jgi:cardiolipin hydrolase